MIIGGRKPRAQTILVVEHDQSVRGHVSRLLSPEGYRVVQACNAEEAVRTAARHHTDIDLLLTETLLPRLSGPDLAELLKLDYPDLKVVYISRSIDAEVNARARQSVVVVGPENPFWGDLLRDAVHRMLDSHERKPGAKILTHSFFSLLRNGRTNSG